MTHTQVRLACARVLFGGSLLAGLLALGCSSADPSGSAKGGAGGSVGGSGTGGGQGGGAGTSSGGSTGGSATAGSGGSTGAGGVAGSIGGAGGVTGAGGTAGTGGSTGTSGAGAGGSAGTGGTGGGSAGIGGTSGSGGSAAGGSTGGTGGRGGSTGGGGGRGGSTGGGGANGGTGGAPMTCPPATPPTGGTRYCSNSKGSAGGNYSYELWAEGTGSGCMTVYRSDAKFSATWTNVEDLLARVGLNFDQTKTPAQIGTISADFAETKTGSNGLVSVGIYGWTVDPLREFYILDDWGETKPAGVASDGTPRTAVGTITVDGETYDVWKKTRENKPNITGTNQTFDQYFSIRRTARQCGRISVSTHFSEWIRLGLPLGKLYEAKLLVEAQDSSGTIDFTTATVVVR